MSMYPTQNLCVFAVYNNRLRGKIQPLYNSEKVYRELFTWDWKDDITLCIQQEIIGDSVKRSMCFIVKTGTRCG